MADNNGFLQKEIKRVLEDEENMSDVHRILLSGMGEVLESNRDIKTSLKGLDGRLKIVERYPSISWYAWHKPVKLATAVAAIVLLILVLVGLLDPSEVRAALGWP